MPLTQWSPSTQISRGNIKVGVAPAVEDLEAPAIGELSAGIGLDCSIQTFNGTSSTNTETIDWLCDPNSEQIPGSTTHTLDDLVIKSTGQDDDDLIAGLSIGDVVYVWRRDGIDHNTDLATGQMVWLWKVVITSIDPLEANNTFIGITARFAVKARSATAVAITA